MSPIKAIYWALLFGLLAACSPSSQSPVFHAVENPVHLSDWNLLPIKNGTLHLGERVTPYDLNTPLFTDYAHKLRTVWLPEGTAASYHDKETFTFPVGTIISKTFYYPVELETDPKRVLRKPDGTAQTFRSGLALSDVKLVETRLLVRREEGWAALPYVWNSAQTEATLKRTGDIQKLELIEGEDSTPFNYVVPNVNQCAGCHAANATTRTLRPIGPKARHLNKDFANEGGPKNQLAAWQAKGILQGLPRENSPKNAQWHDARETVEARARAYLDINCAHCHNAVGPADTSGLLLEPDSPAGMSLGRCKLPIAAGTGTGDRKYGIVPGQPDQSIFTYRMASTNPAVMMPELGRSLAHSEGVALIEDWIADMQGSCE